MKTVIVGGGVGGLALAVALQKVGIPAVVLEQAPAFEAVGAALELWCNALKALRQLGLERRAIELGALVQRTVVVTAGGVKLNEIDMETLAREAGAPTIFIHRSDLQSCLLEKLPKANVMTNARCIGFSEHENGVAARLEDGRVIEGDFLVGADGIHSVVRVGLLGESKPRYAGYTSWRGVVPPGNSKLAPGTMLLALGPGSQVGASHCGSGRIYWFATKNVSRNEIGATEGLKSQVIRLSERWLTPIPEIIASTPEEDILKHDIIDRRPIRNWGRRRVTLLGDAAHPATPNLGQGACQALEDAIALAYCLQRSRSPFGLREYERLRYKRTSRVIRESRWAGRVLQLSGPLTVWARNRFMQTALWSQAANASFQRWAGFEVPEL